MYYDVYTVKYGVWVLGWRLFGRRCGDLDGSGLGGSGETGEEGEGCVWD